MALSPKKFKDWLNGLDKLLNINNDDVLPVIDNTTDSDNPTSKGILWSTILSKITNSLSNTVNGLFDSSSKTGSFNVDISKKNGYRLSASSGTITIGVTGTCPSGKMVEGTIIVDAGGAFTLAYSGDLNDTSNWIGGVLFTDVSGPGRWQISYMADNSGIYSVAYKQIG